MTHELPRPLGVEPPPSDDETAPSADSAAAASNSRDSSFENASPDAPGSSVEASEEARPEQTDSSDAGPDTRTLADQGLRAHLQPDEGDRRLPPPPHADTTPTEIDSNGPSTPPAAPHHPSSDNRLSPLSPPDSSGATDTKTGGGTPWEAAMHSMQVDVGRTVGPYRLVRVIGRGGMGTVYLAERNDGQFEQQVALKITRHDLSRQAQERFLAERQILAQLHHPNIAQLLDGGVTSDGRPYLVMEYVDGTPLTQYCNTHGLSVEARLHLFQQVCDAVQFAHRNLVIHRDLKPSNIIVDEQTSTLDGTTAGPRVKLLDFGVAKALDGAATDGPRTRTGETPMTPAYAAPEQLDGQPVTTATDVYALGVVLCELLCGLLPYDVLNRSVGRVARIIIEDDPTPPSQRVRDREGRPPVVGTHGINADALRRRLQGDLDVIVSKALRKDPEQRYASPVELCRDLDRHLRDQPVEARALTIGYRFRRFIRRNHSVVLAGTAALAALVLGVGAAIWQGRVAAEERDRAQHAALRAEAEGARAQAVQTFLFDMIDRAAPSGDVTLQEVLDEAESELSTSMEGQPELDVEIRTKLGVMYRLLGEHESSIRQTRRAHAVGHAHLGPSHPQTYYAAWQHGTALLRAGRLADADSVLGTAVARLRESGGPPDTHAGLLSTYGELLVLQSRLDTARTSLESARDWYARRATPDTSQIVGIWQALGAVHRRQSRLDDAQTAYEEALRLAEAQDEDDSRTAIADLTNNLANVYRMRGDYARAEAAYRSSLRMQKEIFGPDSPRTATVLANLGRTLRAQGTLDDADRTSREALALFQKLLPASDYRVGVVMGLRGDVLLDQGRLQDADSLLSEAASVVRDALGEAHPRSASLQYRMADLRLRQGRLVQAQEHVEAALAVYETAHEVGHPDVARAQSLLGAILTEQGEYARAEAYLLACDRTQTSRPESEARKKTRQRLAALYDVWGRPDDAERWTEALASSE